jgi:AAA+ ATPase superfamily predicted ATPase
VQSQIIGRKYEQQQLQKSLDSKEAEFIAIYGRRRVGKTYLVRNFFKNKKCIFFQISGIHNAPTNLQLKEFKKEIERIFLHELGGLKLKEPENWMEALELLTDSIQLVKDSQKIVLFFDEFPWMVTHKSGLLSALDYYWNRFWVNNEKIKLIICGSAASWIVRNILNNKGGLHNRVTSKIHLEPFTLYETKEYLKYKEITLTNAQILDLYMCLGGIPYYLKFVEKGLSAAQNINRLCFQKRGSLLDEFKNLFSSLFDHAEAHEEIIKFIATKREGISRKEIEKAILKKGGRLSRRLEELEEAGFIMAFVPWGQKRGIYYKIIDEYTLFYLKWIAPDSTSRLSKEITSKFWEAASQTPSWKAWSGFAFEAICYKHLSNIRKTLFIPDGATATTWRSVPKKGKTEGAQIDLLFYRPDDSVNICEIKYCKEPYAIDKNYSKELQRKVDIFQKITKTDKQIFLSMITACRLKKTMYSEELITSEVRLDDLFKEG